MDQTIFDFGIQETAAGGPRLQWTLVFVVVVFAVFIFIALAIVIRRLLSRPDLHGMSRVEIEKRWLEIESLAEQGLMGSKMAIVEADKLLDSALKSIMMPGMTLGERLKIAQYKYPELRKVWFAHKLRNQLVHETSFEITKAQARAALHEFKHALKVLNVL